MSTASFSGLLIISVIAVMAPVLAASVKALKLPSAVVEIVAGIIVGPSVLAWVKIDQPINVVALLGLAFLLFLGRAGDRPAGGDPRQLRAPLIRAADRRGAVAAGLLQATSLPVIVTAAPIGLAIHAIAPVTASALVAAGLLSVLAFPLTALSVIRASRIGPAAPHATSPDRGDHGPPPAFDGRPVQKEGAPGGGCAPPLPVPGVHRLPRTGNRLQQLSLTLC